MDGQPSLAAGWELSGAIDPRVFCKATIGWIHHGEHGLRWDDVVGCILVADGTRADADTRAYTDTLHEAVVVGVVERAQRIIDFWRDLYRVCKHGAQVTVAGPYWSCTDALADPTRVRGLSEQMFVYLSAPSRAVLRAEPLEDGVALDALADVDFDPVRFTRVTSPEWEARSNEAKNWALTHSLNVCRRLDVVLVAHKPIRKPL